VTFIVPAFGVVWSAILLAEPVGAGLVIGFGLILLSLMLVLGIVPALRWTAVRQRAGERPAVA
jgi:hypothetical protein